MAALADAYQKMQAISASDNRSWVYWAEFHGFNRYECWHHARSGPGTGQLFPYDLFLPWHRAYLSFFDNAARDQNEDAILPWWDWTDSQSHASGLPAAYTGGGQSLQSGPMPAINGEAERRTTRNPGQPGALPTVAQIYDDVTGIIALTDFRDFSNQLQDVHDRIHGWVGGDMGSIGTSAFDPVFWAHHAMIDRIWYQWQLRHGVNNIPPEYLGLALFPGLTVQQVLDVHALGYDYATGAVAGGTGDTEVPHGVGGADADSGDMPTEGETEEPTPTTEGEKYESASLDVGALDTDIYRADIEFYEVDHAGASYEGRVYLNNPDADAGTARTAEAGYAGSYHVFGHGGCLGDEGHCDVEPRRPYDPRPAHPLTKAKKVVRATDAVRAAIERGGNAKVTVVPIVEPLPYANVKKEYIDTPVDIGYVRIVTYR
ncbi:MAG TPA: tyrosinase family protein [Thermoleophilaceae bacterium]